MPRISLGPVNLDICCKHTVLETLRQLILSRIPSQVVTLNALMFNIALRDQELAKTISRSSLIVPDSHGIVWAAGFLNGGTRPARITGIDLLENICGQAAEAGYKVFLLGARPGTARQAADNLKKSYPGLNICGTHHGYFTPTEEENLIKLIADSSPDILFVGFEMPKQELWIAANLTKLKVPVVMGVGGSFDVISGRLKRSPKFLQRLCLEWFYRFLQQPWRLKRLIDLPVFVFNIVSLKLLPSESK